MAAKGKLPTPKKVGRPTKYKPDYHPEKAHKLALLGLTDEEMAVSFDVTTSTIYEWMNRHSEFSEAIKSGKVTADANVAQSLYKKALAGDTTSAIFWLKNRRSKDWRDKQDQDVTLKNPDGTGVFHGVSFVGIDVAAGASSENTECTE